MKSRRFAGSNAPDRKGRRDAAPFTAFRPSQRLAPLEHLSPFLMGAGKAFSTTQKQPVRLDELSAWQREKDSSCPAAPALRGPLSVRPPRSPERPAPCGRTAALAAGFESTQRCDNAKTARPIGRAVCMAAREGFELPRSACAAGAPFCSTASVAGKTGSLRQDGGARRRVRIHAALR